MFRLVRTASSTHVIEYRYLSLTFKYSIHSNQLMTENLTLQNLNTDGYLHFLNTEYLVGKYFILIQ